MAIDAEIQANWSRHETLAEQYRNQPGQSKPPRRGRNANKTANSAAAAQASFLPVALPLAANGGTGA